MAFGGYVRSVNSYSAGASAVILPHIMGGYEAVSRHNVTWDQVAEHTDTVLAFGGMALKNSDVASGGISRHIERDAMQKAARRGAIFYGIAPLRDDMPEEAGARWLPIKVGTDVALMLALAHTLLVENLRDRAFVARYCTGFEIFERYLLGRDDNTPKDAAWAAGITGIPAATIVDLARRLPRGRTLITVSHSLQRAQYGEQPVWMGAVLAAMLGQIGLPGGGYNYALGALGHTGRRLNAVPIPTLSQGRNGVGDFIPVARVADMLLNPGKRFDYNGRSMHYPDIKLVYWAGGNPFHHHQDINRLRRAFNVPANHRRARERLDADGEVCRHRAAGDHDAGARRHRRRRHRSAAGRDAQGRGSDRRSARRFRYFCCALAAIGRRTGIYGRTQQPAMAGPSLRADAARACRCRLGCA